MASTSIGVRSLPLPSWLPRSVWPFQTYGVEAQGATLAVSETGRGPTLLFVHVGLWSFIWRDLVAELAPDFRCILLDAPGNGLTIDDAGSTIGMERASRAVESVLDALDLEEFVLVVHDLGGPVGLGAVAHRPERVRGIIALNSFAWSPSRPALKAMLAVVGSRLLTDLDVATGVIPRITASAFGVGRHLDERARRAFLAGLGPRARRAFHSYMRDAARCESLYERVDRALRGPLAALPLLTIFGERNDPFGFQPRWKDLFPAAEQLVIAGGNHFPMCDAPDFVASSIRAWHNAHGVPDKRERPTERALPLSKLA